MNNSTTRQNLDSIVEAIRHLEGDHLFSSEEIGAGPQQVITLIFMNCYEYYKIL